MHACMHACVQIPSADIIGDTARQGRAEPRGPRGGERKILSGGTGGMGRKTQIFYHVVASEL